MGIKQYQIVVVNLDPTIGSELKKIRPCVVISPDEMNQHLNTIVVAPLTTNKKAYPTRVKVTYQGKEGRIIIDQIRTIDKTRVVKVSDLLSKTEIVNIKDVINRTFVL